MSVAFDTLRLARSLRDKARFSAEQAEGVDDAISEVPQGDLATKRDLTDVHTDLRAEIVKVRADLGADIAKVRTDLGADIAKVRADLGAEIVKVRADLGADIAEIRADLRIEISAAKNETIRWVVGMIGFQTIVILGAAVTLARVLAK